jgi:hypothetical protein
MVNIFFIFQAKIIVPASLAQGECGCNHLQLSAKDALAES